MPRAGFRHLREGPGASPARLLGTLTLALVIAACGKSSDPVVSYQCSPACPPGTVCADTGCVPITPAATPDMSAQPDQSSECGQQCGGSTPFCRAGTCVGCLVDTDCPAGNVCRAVGAASTCVPGCKDDARCAGRGGADGGGGNLRCCGGQCLDVSADQANCGACGTQCMTPHAGAACSGGRCTAGACAPGWGDCNMNLADGCETNLLVDQKNCGACGVTCSFKNGLAGCAAGCYLAACLFGYDDCDGKPENGCETSVINDPRNCGACANSCPLVPHAKEGCVNSSCQLVSCDMGFLDCNGDPRDGCEINSLIDNKNCGLCGVACPNGLFCKNGACTCPQCNFPNAKSACVNLQCVLTGCLPGWGDCNGDPKDGCEVSLLTDPKNCGACGNACAGKTPYCNSGNCVDNPCTGQAGGIIAAAMGTPMYGTCWYLSVGGETCDDVCALTGGANDAKNVVDAFPDDCNGGGMDQPATWFFNNGNACPFTKPNGAPTGYLTLGHGYNQNDNSGRNGVYLGKCTKLQNLIVGQLGSFPGDNNDSKNTGNSRCVVCACTH